MESPFEKTPKKDLGERLVTGRIDAQFFLDALLERDQASPTYAIASENIKMLTRPDVRELIIAHPEHLFQYQNLLSISYFHRGKAEALSLDNGSAVASFTEALSWAQHALEHADAGYRSWVLYVEGTVAYFNSDLDTLRRAYGEIESENRSVLGNLIQSLEVDGRIDYRKAYGSTR